MTGPISTATAAATGPHTRRGALAAGMAAAVAGGAVLIRPDQASAATPAISAGDAIAAARALHPLIGAWQVGVTHPAGQPAPPGLPVTPGTLLFGADGSVVWSGLTPVTGTGVWQPSGATGFTYVFHAPTSLPDATQPLGFSWTGFLRIRATGTVSGNSYTATGQGVQYDAAGTAGQASQATTTAVRITVAGG